MLNERYDLPDWVVFPYANEDEEYEILPYFEIIDPALNLEKIQREYDEIMKSDN